ncbi:threonyl/alanyl trna synthetase sad [Lucifera butyrica]|uniref:Threonyl/alanyl trna synthetase sad n=1 Tax=Lucifera butyrica TaxID=1351585 RepID=A0A498R634_9FIRM|nr:DHHA1 domain-containing protein [Lucifera butyrica]VBB06307.1 threonyl/alanyl trna synthetase sad [Lucifera butyrica]
MYTEKLYYQDSYVHEFSAAVIKCTPMPDGQWKVVLDRTAFYPEGGGQPCDTGFINRIPVTAVRQEQDEIVHIMPECPGQGTLKGQINWDRRFDHMQQHSGEHVLSAVFQQLYEAENIGFHLGTESTQIDLALDKITAEEIAAAEKLANEMIYANKPVRSQEITPDRLEQFPLRKQIAKEYFRIRLVDIENLDCCPCGGTHVQATGEIGLIKIRSWERKNNAIRVDFVCGQRALGDFQQKNLLVQQLSSLLSTPVNGLVQAIEKQAAKLEETMKQLAAVKEEFTRILAANLLQQSPAAAGIHLISHILTTATPSETAELAKQLASFPHTIALVGGINPEQNKCHLVFACSDEIAVNMGTHLKSVLPLIGGKGGGNARSAQGGGLQTDRVDIALSQAKQNILQELDGKDR